MSARRHQTVSAARQERRAHVVAAARALVGVKVSDDFDLIHSPLCPIDVVMVAGAPWLKDGLERDFSKDEGGYRKIGGGANTPAAAYFYRSAINVIHYLKRQGLYIPRGTEPPMSGMACFFEWGNRGRFNFTPDRSGVITEVKDGRVTEVVMAVQYEVQRFLIEPEDTFEQALIGYSDLP